MFYNRNKLKRILLFTCRAQRQYQLSPWASSAAASTSQAGGGFGADYDEWVSSAMDTE